MPESLRALWSIMPHEPEFWSGIIGAVVGAVTGGIIAYIVQVKALREARNLREEDHKKIQQGLANALIIKMMRVHSNFYGIHRHIEDSFETAARSEFMGEPWQFVVPLVNPPSHVHFSSEEIGMLLSLKDSDTFNAVLSMDVLNNSLTDAIKVLNSERIALTEKLKAEKAEGVRLSGSLNREQELLLRPRMIGVNSLIESIRIDAKRNYEESGIALDRVHNLFREKLGLGYKLESIVKSTTQTAQ